MKRFIKTLLLIGWLILIYVLSNQNAVISSQTSSRFLTMIGNTINYFVNINVEDFVLTYGFLVRKIAHFSEYFILFILAYECFKEYNIKKVLFISLLFCVICASLDEFHQFFVDGRSMAILDIIIDSCGSLVSCFIWRHLFKR